MPEVTVGLKNMDSRSRTQFDLQNQRGALPAFGEQTNLEKTPLGHPYLVKTLSSWQDDHQRYVYVYVYPGFQFTLVTRIPYQLRPV